jgi:excisionase family DNA binding protein
MGNELMKTAAAPFLVDCHEAARLAAVSPRTIWQATKDGKLRAVRFGRAVRYDPEDIRRWIESLKTNTTTTAA